MKLILDLDSTLADLMSPWMLWLHQVGLADRIHELEDVKTYDWMERKWGTQAHGFFHDDPHHIYSELVQPFNGAREFVEWCHEHFDTEIVTHSYQQSTTDAKTNWVKENLGFDRIRFFSELDDKYAHVKDSILVDDYPLHIIRHVARNNCPGVLFDYNKENGWSKMEDYKEMQIDEKFKQEMYRYANSYRDAQKSILELMG